MNEDIDLRLSWRCFLCRQSCCSHKALNFFHFVWKICNVDRFVLCPLSLCFTLYFENGKSRKFQVATFFQNSFLENYRSDQGHFGLDQLIIRTVTNRGIFVPTLHASFQVQQFFSFGLFDVTIYNFQLGIVSIASQVLRSPVLPRFDLRMDNLEIVGFFWSLKIFAHQLYINTVVEVWEKCPRLLASSAHSAPWMKIKKKTLSNGLSYKCIIAVYFVCSLSCSSSTRTLFRQKITCLCIHLLNKLLENSIEVENAGY